MIHINTREYTFSCLLVISPHKKKKHGYNEQLESIAMTNAVISVFANNLCTIKRVLYSKDVTNMFLL